MRRIGKMPRIIKSTDFSQGHCWPPAPFIRPTGNRTVFTSNLPVAVLGDSYEDHPGPCGNAPTHTPLVIMGSPNVFIQNLPVLRDGDILSCGDVANSLVGSVFVNGG